MFAKTFILTGLAYVASAHMLMSNPVPYGKSTLDNSPLDKNGADFPCKMRGNTYSAEGASNVYAQGSKQHLSFIGSAVHGGGSCQISITTDLQPNKNSVWKVIKSIEGGCPARDQAGNMPENPDAIDPYKYDFTIPAELAAGKYTLAWTWFNKIGNREMYMNCAPLEVTGSGGSKSHLDSLPDMFVANLGDGCGTEPDTDLKFPNPGQDVDLLNGATKAFAGPTGTCKTGGNSGGNGGGAQPTQVTKPAGTAPVTSAAPKPKPTSGGIPGGVFITVADPSDSEPPATTLVPVVSAPVASEAPVVTTAPASNPTPTPGTGNGSDGGSGSGSGSGSGPKPGNGSGNGSGDGAGSNPGSGSGSGSPNEGFAAGAPCTSEGNWNCIGGSSFQRCASGAWSAPQALSQGVTCTPGQSTDINLSARRGETAMRRSQRIRD